MLFVETFEKVQRHTSQTVTGATQAALAEFIGDGDFATHIRRMTRISRGRRDRLARALASAAGDRLAITPPAGGMQLLARLERGSDDCRSGGRSGQDRNHWRDRFPGILPGRSPSTGCFLDSPPGMMPKSTPAPSS